MLYIIYGVKIIGAERERRHYGWCETGQEASKAIDMVLNDCDYAYAKHPGGAPMIFREKIDRYPYAPLQAKDVHRQFPG